MNTWTPEKIDQLKSLVETHTNREIAKIFDIDRKSVSRLLNRLKIKRTPETVKIRLAMPKGSQIGELNHNWKGGISKEHLRYRIKYKKKYPKKVKAQNILYQALRRGKIKRLSCRICLPEANWANIQALHLDYSQPLKVIWLCIKHYNEVTKNGK